MRLISLKLVQWRSFERCELDFPDGLIGVVGVNGAGKTTLAEAIGWALFGKLRPGAKLGDVPRQGADRDRSLVELVFRLEDVVYRVERVVSGPAKLWIGDSDEPETSAVTATNALLVRELDMTWETFQRTVFARQKDVAALDPAGTGDARRRHVERLLGLERYRFAAERARSRLRVLEAELRGLREGAPDLNVLRAEAADAAEAAVGSDPAVLEAEAALEQAKEAVAAVEQDLEHARALGARHAVLAGQRNRAAVAVEQLTTRLQARRAQAAERAAKIATLAALDGRGDDPEALGAARRAWDDLSACDRALREAEAQAPKITYDPDAAAERRERLVSVRAEIDQIHKAPAPDLHPLAERVEALKLAQGVASVAGARARLQELEEKRDEARQGLAVLEADIGRDREHLEQIERDGPDAECIVCLRPYGSDFKRILEEHRRRQDVNIATLAEVRQTLEALEGERHGAASAYDAATRAADALARTAGADQLEPAQAALAAGRAAADDRDDRLAELHRARRELEAAVEADEAAERATADHRVRVAERRTRLEAALTTVAVDTYDRQAHDVAVQRHEESVAAQNLKLELRSAIDASAGIEADVAELEASLAQAALERDGAVAELEALAFDPASDSQLRGVLAAATERKDTAAEHLGAARAAAQARDARVSELRRRVEEAEEAHARIAERERSVREHEVVARILTDFRTAQNERAWPRLEEGASALLSETTDGRYVDVRLSTDYKLVIVDRGEEHGLERFSGGEQDLANLCLRLAIADWVARERGVEMGFVVLDEVFGSQDEERRRRLVDELRTLSHRFHQLLVITHVPDIADLCEHQIRVNMAEEGRSVAELAPG